MNESINRPFFQMNLAVDDKSEYNGWGWKICRDTDQKRPLQTNCTLQAAAVVFNMEGPWDFT
jgi:hypothetical protein